MLTVIRDRVPIVEVADRSADRSSRLAVKGTGPWVVKGGATSSWIRRCNSAPARGIGPCLQRYPDRSFEALVPRLQLLGTILTNRA